MTFNQTFGISLSSMQNNQYALTVVSQNIANMDVEGYLRQRVNFQTNTPSTKSGNVIEVIKGMNGASISSLSNYLDEATFNNYINSNSDASYYNTLADGIGNIENIIDALGDNGLNSLLDNFYTASVSLEQYPTDTTMRSQYMTALSNVCDKFNEIANECNSYGSECANSVLSDVDRVNSLLNELAEANVAHAKNNKGTTTQSTINTILSELSNYVNVETKVCANGMYNFYIGDTEIVSGKNVNFELQASYNPDNADEPLQFSLKSLENGKITNENINDSITSGSLKGYIDLLNYNENNGFSTPSSIKADIDSAAKAFANALNEIQLYDDGKNVFAASITTNTEGDLILEKSTSPLLEASDDGEFNAGNIKVNNNVVRNPYLIATARIDLTKYTDKEGNVDPSWVKSIGNSDNAVEFTKVQNQKICSYGSDTNNCTLSQFLTNVSAKAGLDTANIQSKADLYNTFATSAKTDLDNAIGVNLDEELSDMIKYQRAYEASAKVFSAVSDLMLTVINMV